MTEPWVGLSPQARKARIFATLHQLFLESSRAQPLVVEVENLHWADPSTEEYLTALVARLSGVPVLLLVSYRPGYRPPWMASSISAQIALLPLAPHHSRRLVQAALRHQALPAVVLQQMLTKAGGNPLFLEELALSVSEQSEAAQALAVPDTIQAVLAARIDRLPSEAKYLLQTSAVIGSEVPEPLLRAIVTLPDEILAESLSHLQTSEFLFETRVFPTLTYTFKHALTQEVAYRSLLRRRRQQIHAQIVQVVSRDFPELAEAQPERLAHHATEAGLHAQAVSYWLRAGQRAVERSAHQEAITHLTKGLDLLQMSPQTPERIQQELMFHIALGAARLITEGHAAPDVPRMYTRAYELCQQVEETPQFAPVLLGLWRFYLVRGELAQAQVLSERLLSLAQRLDDPSLLVLAHYMLGTTLFWSGALVQASLHLEEGTARYDPHQHRALAFHSGQDPGVACLAFAARALWILGCPDQALRCGQEALRCARDLDHPFSQAFALTFLGYIHLRHREWRAAQTHAETVIALATAQGFPFWRALGTIQHGWALAAQGQAEAGLTEMRQGVTSWQATGAGLGKPFFLGLVAEVHGYLEQHAEGLSLLTEALAVVDLTGERWCEPDLYRLKEELLLACSPEDQTDAESCLRHALALARRQQARSWELRTALILLRLWLQHGRQEGARQLPAEVFSWFTEGFDTTDLQEAKALLEALA